MKCVCVNTGLRCVFMCMCMCVCVCIDLFVCVCVCVCVCVLEHIHQSPYLKPVVPALLTRAAQSPNLIAHTPLYCTNLNATEKSCIAFSHLWYIFTSVFSPFKKKKCFHPLFPVWRSSLYSGPKVDILWYSKRYIDIYMYSIYNDDTLHIFVAFYVVDLIVYMWLFLFG